jgi:sulfonate transport system ATP-binding protein
MAAMVDELVLNNPAATGGALEIAIAHKTFSTPHGPLTVLRDIYLAIDLGEFVCIVGGSGCGKTTLLRIVAGLETDYEGAVRLDGRRIARPDLNRGVVFQKHRLLPWLTVHDNVLSASRVLCFRNVSAKSNII